MKLWLWFLVPVLPYVVIYAIWPTAHLFQPDDAFYYFKIATNLGAGWGSTFDRINPTNGYHPLWLLLLTPLSTALSSKTLFVGVVLVLQCIMVSIGLRVIFDLFGTASESVSARAALLVSICLLWNYYCSKMVINGLESALFFVLAAILLHAFSNAMVLSAEVSLRKAAGIGGIAALMLLSRLDSVLYVGVIPLVWVAHRRDRVRREWTRIALVVAVPTVVLLGYMFANQVTFGIWMPVSGYVKRFAQQGAISVTHVGGYLAFVMCMAAALRATWGRRRSPDKTAARIALLTVSGFLLLYQADSMLIRGYFIPEIWYLSQHLLWVFMVATLLIGCSLRRAPRSLRYAGTAALALLATAGIVVSWNVRLQRSSYDLYLASYEAAQWIDRHLPEHAVVAGWDIGIVGYYAERGVVNLDGLVNSSEYVQEYLQQDRGIAFLDGIGVQYIVQHFRHGFERFRPRGFDADELRRRLGEVVWSRTVTFASMADFFATGRRVVRQHVCQVRRYEHVPHTIRSPETAREQAERAD